MQQGKRLVEAESLEAIAHRTRTAVTQLPASCRQIHHPTPLEATPSNALKTLTENTQKRIQHAYTH